MIKFDSFGHVCIIVDNIDEATAFYTSLFHAEPIQDFPHFKNKGFAQSAGFMDEPEAVDVTIRFLKLPIKEGFFIELMQYHYPIGKVVANQKEATDRNLVAHIALRVTNMTEAFEHVKQTEGVRLISNSPDYKPFKIDTITPNDFYFFDQALEENLDEKDKVCDIVSHIR
ncbi:MAG: VOC family protein [bacterium]